MTALLVTIPGPLHGKQRPSTRARTLTEAEAERVCRMRARGLSWPAIARVLGVSSYRRVQRMAKPLMLPPRRPYNLAGSAANQAVIRQMVAAGHSNHVIGEALDPVTPGAAVRHQRALMGLAAWTPSRPRPKSMRVAA